MAPQSFPAKTGGIVARRRAALMAAGLAMVPAMALADTADTAAQVSEVTVLARATPLDRATGLAVLPTSVQDTPQTMQVISTNQLKAQGVTSLEQALRNVPGITVAIGEGGTLNGDQFKIRGFDAKDDVYIDGLRDFGVYTRDSFNYEEVQVLKGPAGAMFGRGTTGGVVNTVSKTPRPMASTSVDGYVGAGAYYRGLLDSNAPLNATTAFRLNLMASSTGVVDRDRVNSKRWGVAPSIALGMGTDTRLVASYLHQHDERRPDYGVTIVQPPGRLVAQPATAYDVGVKRNVFLGYDADKDRTDADIVTVRLTHEATPWITLTSDSRVGAYKRYFQYSTVDQCAAACTANLFDGNPATIPAAGMGGGGPYDQDAWGVQNLSTARLDFRTGRFRNQLILGLDASYQNNKKLFYAYILPTGITARNLIPRDLTGPSHQLPAGYAVFLPSPGNIVCPTSAACTTATSATVLRTTGDSSDIAGFVTERFWFTDGLSLIGSVRADAFRSRFDQVTVAGAFSTLAANANLTNPRVSLVYEPSKTQTYYLSWGRSATPQGASVVGAGTALAAASAALEPEVAASWELGAKTAVLNNMLSLSAAIFDVKKNNATQIDPITGFLASQSGETQEIKGLELGAAGKLTSAWTLSAAYSYLDAKILSSFSNCAVPATTTGAPTTIVCPVGATAALPVANTVAIGRQVTFVPRNSASLWTTYDLSRAIKGLSVGGGVTWQDTVYLGYTGVSASYANRSTLVPSKIAQVPQQTTLDAVATYATGRYRVALNVYNLADSLNYTQLFGNRAVPVAGRAFILSVGATF
jgi:catecholate siderophore receptor